MQVILNFIEQYPPDDKPCTHTALVNIPDAISVTSSQIVRDISDIKDERDSLPDDEWNSLGWDKKIDRILNELAEQYKFEVLADTIVRKVYLN